MPGSHHAASVSSPYTRLNDERYEFRILQLLPGTGEEVVRCQLSIVTLQCAPPYEALSYAWGTSESEIPILVDGKPRKVMVNLYSALLHLRRADVSLSLFVDAVCIHQEDLVEKGQQVQLMGSIFKHCTRVYVWLGAAPIVPSRSLVKDNEVGTVDESKCRFRETVCGRSAGFAGFVSKAGHVLTTV